MGHKVKQSSVNSRVDFFYYTFRNILIVSIPLLVVCGVVLSHLSFHSSATGSTSGSDNLAITISSSCTLSSVVNIPHNVEVYNGNYLGDIGKTTIKTLCNDGNGYSVYVVGYSNNEEGNNKLINTEYPQYSIDTGLATSGLTSQWAMKLNNIPDDPSPTPPTIESDYNNVYGIVPPYWTKVAERASGTTDMAEGSSFTTTYAVYASSSQYAGTYQGQVKYLLTHPNSNSQHLFMQDVDMWGNSVLANIGDSIQAIDIRDGKQYWVTRLADGNIWMTQNLDLDLSPSTTLTSNDTDLNDNSMAGAYSKDYTYDAANNVISWTPQNTTRDYQAGTGTVWGNDNNVAYSLDPGEWYWDGDDSTPNCNYLNASAGCTHFTQDRTNANRHLSVGNYYNWSAAIASDDSSSLTSSTYGDANSDPNATDRNPQNSICPKGWRLPTISYQGNIVNSTSEFARVNGIYNDGITNNDKKLIESPLWFVRSGGINNGNLNSPGFEAVYWSSTVYSSLNAYHLDFMATNVDPAYNYGRRSGWSVRCVAR